MTAPAGSGTSSGGGVGSLHAAIDSASRNDRHLVQVVGIARTTQLPAVLPDNVDNEAMIRPLLVLLLVGRVAAAEPTPSPRLTALAAKPATQDAFWKQVVAEGTPLVEDIKDPKGRLLVSFLYRAKPGIKHVAMYNAPNGTLFGYQQLARIPKTDTFAWSTLVAPDARFTYFLAPGDNFGPLVGNPQFEKRQLLWIPDPTNKRPYLVSGSML